jgi:hypothetical protein
VVSSGSGTSGSARPTGRCRVRTRERTGDDGSHDRDGGLERKYDGHQRKKALESFRVTALHAFKHGASMDDVQLLLQETFVEATLEG